MGVTVSRPHQAPGGRITLNFGSLARARRAAAKAPFVDVSEDLCMECGV